ncbi:MAG: UDP-N-acetylmuramoyl-tripeptide--D-alanyl-D-alanine ligase [Saprospiraceae bacterium]|nr:UDP-N-acetylmuramoyl-tripeptide--D-alanyl-D-alanine ligase [Saprospiraceae bacterium]
MNLTELYQIFLESNGVSIDSRTIRPGEIFFALKGDVFDGHRFIDKAIENGASLVIIQDEKYTSEHTVYFNDSLKCLQELALYHRQQFNVPVIGLTGSNGKTTTKELMNVALSSRFRVHATRGNFNNHIGVPLTLLSIPDDTEIIIVEMGANHIGEIDFLCHLSEPNYGLITNIGDAHIEGFGSREGVIKAKTELYRYLYNNNGKIFYNPEDKTLKDNMPMTAETISYDMELSFFESRSLRIGFSKPKDTVYQSNLYGIYNRQNITAAYSVARYFNIPHDEICKSIADYIPSMNRSQLIEKKDVVFIMDAYNANPTSMQLAIESFSNLNTSKGKSLVLGDMLELGEYEIKYHEEIVNQLLSLGFDKVILVGKRFLEADAGNEFNHYSSVDELLVDPDRVNEIIKGTVCMVKGSRSMKLEKIEDLY